jgi:lipopolysaccharide transport system ATP-binding protein
MPSALKVTSVSKHFRLFDAKPLTLRESWLRWLAGKVTRSQEVCALEDVSFEVERGRSLGIVGHNGAGKSTLLRLLCGLGRPTSGSIERTGVISGILELGGGFHPDLTGRENLLTAGLLNGLSKAEVKAREDRIIAFAELEKFIDKPVRIYSSGMYLRLAFSVAIEFDPDILVIDELLAVGDLRFQQKCLERIRAFHNDERTLLLTSHDTEQIQRLCDEVLVLEEGRAVMQADPVSAIRYYQDLLRQRTERRLMGLTCAIAPRPVSTQGSRHGTQEASLEDVRLTGLDGRTLGLLQSGDGFTIELQYRLAEPLPDMILTVGLFSESHVKCFEATIPSVRSLLGDLPLTGKVRCHLPHVPLQPGCYYVNAGLYSPTWEFVYDYHWQMHPLLIGGGCVAPGVVSGVVALDPIWSETPIWSQTAPRAGCLNTSSSFLQARQSPWSHEQ